MTSTRAIRNIAIIAHVDHGKTTLVDKLLRAAGTFRANQEVQERVMDSGDLERERGITILAKNCAVEYEGTHINIIDTPGHADFGGEVERVLSMVDGVLLLVDAVEGPMPQTRFVTRKALALGLKPIVVINKIDRPGSRPDWVLNQTFDLFDKLGATEEQLDFPVIYCSAIEGVAGYTDDFEELKKIGNMRAIFDTVLEKVPVRDDDPDGPLQLQICSLDYSSYVGKIGIGRVHRGRIHAGEDVYIMNGPDDTPKKVKVNQLLMFHGLDRTLVDSAEAGDIVLVNGIEDLSIGTTITALLASIGQSKNAKRTAVAHSVFNITGSILFLCILPLFAQFVMYISPAGPETAVISRQIANAHTSFNLINTLLWLPLIPLMVKIVCFIVPDKKPGLSTKQVESEIA